MVRSSPLPLRPSWILLLTCCCPGPQLRHLWTLQPQGYDHRESPGNCTQVTFSRCYLIRNRRGGKVAVHNEQPILLDFHIQDSHFVMVMAIRFAKRGKTERDHATCHSNYSFERR